jgi:hypothetical protein
MRDLRAPWDEDSHMALLTTAEDAITRCQNCKQWTLERIFCSRQYIAASRRLLRAAPHQSKVALPR